MWGRSTCSTVGHAAPRNDASSILGPAHAVGRGEHAPGPGCNRGLEDGNFLTVSMLSGSKSLCRAVENFFDFSKLTS